MTATQPPLPITVAQHSLVGDALARQIAALVAIRDNTRLHQARRIWAAAELKRLKGKQ